MCASFSWDRTGLNQDRFRAYSTLLHIRSGGQAGVRSTLEAEPELEVDDSHDSAENDSTVAQTISSFDETKLKESFQDRVAELVSNAKGGYHVVATLLIECPDGFRLVVAKNEGLNKKDQEFLDKIQGLLRRIAKSHALRDDGQREGLWEEMLSYYDARLDDWITEFQRVAQTFTRRCSADSLPVAISRALRLEVLDLLDKSYKDSTSTLIEAAHAIWNSYEQQDFDDACNNRLELARKLRLSIGFLGRLKIGFNVIVRSAERLNKLQDLIICPLSGWSGKNFKMKKGKGGNTSWTLAQTFQSLSLPLDDATIKYLFGSKWTKHRLIREFDKFQTQPPQIHVEAQLVLYAAQLKPSEGTPTPYIGCSKRSCFLCWEFLKAYGAYRTRASHGKIYSLWTIPIVDNLPPERMTMLISALESVEEGLKIRLRNKQQEFLRAAKESTVGGSSIATRLPSHTSPQTTDLILKYLLHQRHAENNRILTESSTIIEEELYAPDSSETEDLRHSAIQKDVVENDGLCDWCEKRTARCCPHCDKGRYCSSTCAANSVSHRFACAGQALTTADYLEQAVLQDTIPDDPQTMDDYGFSRCENWMEQSHLLGLYIGLLTHLDVPSQNLHAWKLSGRLVENIIGKYSELPEGSRGGYFPWFLQHTQILDDRSEAKPSQRSNLLADALRDARTLLPVEDQDKDFAELQPVERRDAFFFFTIARQHMHPPPTGPGNMWYGFGFCTCADEHEERRLGGLYSRLFGGNKFMVDYDRSLGSESPGHATLPTPSFAEFWPAFRDGELIQLMDRYGLREERRNFKHLESFLALRPAEPHPPVWRLCHYLAFEPGEVAVPAEAMKGARHYGFSPELNARQKMELWRFYKSLTGERNPSEIDDARTHGALLDYAHKHLGRVEEGLAQILRQLK